MSIAYILTESSKVQFSIEAELQKAESEKLNELILSFDTNERKTDKFIDSAFHLGLYISLLLVKFTGNKIELKKNDNLYSLQFSLPNFSSEDPVAQYRIKPFPKMKQQYNWEGKLFLLRKIILRVFIILNLFSRPLKPILLLQRWKRSLRNM